MRPSRPVFPVFACLAACLTTVALPVAPVFAESAAAAAAHALGPNWQQLSRRAGMIFAGTILASPPASVQTATGVPSAAIRMHVNRAIAGVEPGQTLTIREWTGALSRHPAMRPGEHLLLCQYPPSRLGLTSPVGGSQGQLRLDSQGDAIIDPSPTSRDSQRASPGRPPGFYAHSVPLPQLERAIRAARGE